MVLLWKGLSVCVEFEGPSQRALVLASARAFARSAGVASSRAQTLREQHFDLSAALELLSPTEFLNFEPLSGSEWEAALSGENGGVLRPKLETGVRACFVAFQARSELESAENE